MIELPALTPAQMRRLACDAAVTAVLTHGPHVLAQGRAPVRHPRATPGPADAPGRPAGAPPERARAGGRGSFCCRFSSSGGRTAVSDMVLLCDVCHGLVHDHDLVLSRPGGRLVAWTATSGGCGGPADEAGTGSSARRGSPERR